MVVNTAFLEGAEKYATQTAQAGSTGLGGHAGLAGRSGESDAERAARVQQLSLLVKGGTYNVKADRLAMALLDWDPRRSTPRGSVETAGRRRAYMRDYMRRRRATQPDSDLSDQAWANTTSGSLGAFGTPECSNGNTPGLAPPAAAGTAWAAFALASS